MPQTLAVCAPHCSGREQPPQWRITPQPSSRSPQSAPCSAQLRDVQTVPVEPLLEPVESPPVLPGPEVPVSAPEDPEDAVESEPDEPALEGLEPLEDALDEPESVPEAPADEPELALDALEAVPEDVELEVDPAPELPVVEVPDAEALESEPEALEPAGLDDPHATQAQRAAIERFRSMSGKLPNRRRSPPAKRERAPPEARGGARRVPATAVYLLQPAKRSSAFRSPLKTSWS
jgi:hypothetical protein